MFSQASVKNFARGDMCGEGGACVAGDMATSAGGTHPTRMHSC